MEGAGQAENTRGSGPRTSRRCPPSPPLSAQAHLVVRAVEDKGTNEAAAQWEAPHCGLVVQRVLEEEGRRAEERPQEWECGRRHGAQGGERRDEHHATTPSAAENGERGSGVPRGREKTQ